MTVFLQVEDLGFAGEPMILGGSPTTSDPISVAAVDIDGDGDVDLASANAGGDDVTLFSNIAAGRFDPVPRVLGGDGILDGPNSLVAADLDGNGTADLVTANTDGDDLTLYHQDESGDFAQSPLALGGSSRLDGPTSLGASDIDGDGDLDLVAANRGSGDLVIFIQADDGAFEVEPVRVGNAAITPEPLSVTAADLDGDGSVDLFCGGTSGNRIFFQARASDLDLEHESLTGPQPSSSALSATDLDGDGDLDLAGTDASAGLELAVRFQRRPGVFDADPFRIGEPDRSSQWLTTGDLDGDGDVDLAVTSQAFESTDIRIFFQATPGSFDQTPLALTGKATSVVAADLDGDGDLDLGSTHKDALAPFSDLIVHFQEERGDFGAPALTPLPSVTVAGSLIADDIDGDGDLDLVATTTGFPTSAMILLQEGIGSFAGEPIQLGSAVGRNFNRVTAADMDGDGDDDLVVADVFGSALRVFFQEGLVDFSPEPLSVGSFSTLRRPRLVIASDFDDDGDQDLVSSAVFVLPDFTSVPGIALILQSGPRSFSPPQRLGPAISPPLFAVVADLDGDGERDIAFPSGLLWGGR